MRDRCEGAEDSGVADEDVEPAPPREDGRAHAVDDRRVLEVGRDQAGGSAVGADRVVDLLQRALRASDQDQFRTLGSKALRHSPADPAGGAGDQGDAAGETTGAGG